MPEGRKSERTTSAAAAKVWADRYAEAPENFTVRFFRDGEDLVCSHGPGNAEIRARLADDYPPSIEVDIVDVAEVGTQSIPLSPSFAEDMIIVLLRILAQANAVATEDASPRRRVYSADW